MAGFGSLSPDFSWVDEGTDPAAAQSAAEVAAARQRNAVRSHYGRPEGVATKVLDSLGESVYNTAAKPARIWGALQEVPAGQPLSERPDIVDAVAQTATDLIGLPALTPGAAVRGAGEVLGSGAIRRTKGLPMDTESRIARMREQGFEPGWYHGGERIDRFVEQGKIDPRRATSGPMPFFTDNPEVASGYASGKKADTSLMKGDPGDTVANYFTVSPKAFGFGGRSPVTVEQSWHYLPPELKAEIKDKAARIGYANRDRGDGPFTLHPAGEHGGPSSADHWDYALNRENRGNPLAALRDLWHDGGMLVDDPGKLSEIYRLAGYPHPISETRAPWTEARGVFPAALRMRNPLVTENTDLLTKDVLPSLAEEFKRDRTRLNPHGVDMWAKDSRWTPRDWVAHAQEEYAKGANPYVFTSIPDKITGALERRGYDSILDTGGKSTPDYGHRVAIPFRPDQVRSIFGRFDPANEGSGMLLGANSADRKTGAAIIAGQHAQDASPFGSLHPGVKTPGLPMDEASRMQRAADQGFDTGRTLYHGTSKDFGSFDPSMARRADGAKPEPGVFLSSDPKIASGYSGYDPRWSPNADGARVLPVHVKNGNYKEVDFGGSKHGRPEAVAQAKAEGYDGVTLKNHYDAGGVQDQTVVFDPKNIRSRSAAFDPANKDSGFLLGANAGDKRVTGAVAAADVAEPAFGSLAPAAKPDPLASLKARNAEVNQHAQQIAEEAAAKGGFKSSDGKMMLTREISSPENTGGWRLTHFDGKMPTGHIEGTAHELARDIVHHEARLKRTAAAAEPKPVAALDPLAVGDGGRVQMGAVTRDVVPFPSTPENNRLRSKLTDEGGFVEADLPIRSMYSTQREANPDFAGAAARRAGEKDGYELPAVYRVDGKNYLTDGHHRVADAATKGSTARVRFYDMDKARSGDVPDPRQMTLLAGGADKRTGAAIAAGDAGQSFGALSPKDTSHLSALELRLSHERDRLRGARTDKERQMRQVWVDGIEKEIAQEHKFLGIKHDVAPNMNDDELLAALGGK